MAALTTAQKAPVTVKTAAGADVPLNAVQITVDEGGAISWSAPGGVLTVSGEKAGTGTLTVVYGNQRGTLAVTVEEAPLVLTLGEPVAK